MNVQLAVVGIGRIGVIHALHAWQVAKETDGCKLTALVDSDVARAKQVAANLSPYLKVFASVEELIASGVANASVVCTPTDCHQDHAGKLIEAGQRVLLEKPMTDAVASDRAFARYLQDKHPNSLMLAFQRRFDGALGRAKKLLDDGVIGRPFKILSILEDSGPAPAGYRSGGILTDMSVHNVDEVLWLTGRMPVAAASSGNRIYGHRLTSNVEDFDDASMTLWFEGEMVAQIQVSRNHVSGYHVETWIFGEEGQIHIGHFNQKHREVLLEVYGRRDRKEPLRHEVFHNTDYGRPVPEFVDRFGPAYKEEVRVFVNHCVKDTAFPVNHNDGLRAMEVIEAALSCPWQREQAAKVQRPI